MNDAHLTDAELLDVADGVAGEAARSHAASCPQCGAAVAEAWQGRQLLQSAAPLEEPPSLSGAIARLPRRSRPRLRVLAMAAPAAAVAGAIAAAVVLSTGGGTPSRQAGKSAGFRSDTAAPQVEAVPVPARSVAGPAGAVVATLRHAGFKAAAKGPNLVVVHGDAAAVARALARRPSGPVHVDVRP
jgi:hypothetical protein